MATDKALLSVGWRSTTNGNGKVVQNAPTEDAPIWNDPQAERSVLASMLLDPDFVEEALRELTPDHFYHSMHRSLFETMRDVWNAGEPVDVYSLSSELSRRGVVEQAEATIFLLDLMGYVASSVFGKSKIPSLRKLFFVRQAQKLLQTTLDRSMLPGMDATALYNYAREMLSDLAPTVTKAAKTWTGGELLRTAFSDPVWVVPGLLPAGFTVLAGRPKLGKSWLALQVASAVAAAGKVLEREANAHKVLYLALEDNERRIKERLQKQQAPELEDLHFRFEWAPLTTPLGIDELNRAIDANGYGLVVVDTISRALGEADQQDQATMNVRLGLLQRMAIERNIAVLVVDHHRKPGASAGDVIDDVMGATSKTGVADAAMGLYRQRGQAEATLKVTGRDISDMELVLGWDHDLSCWQFLGDAATVREDSAQAGIVEALEELGGRASTKQLAEFMGHKPQNVSRELQELVAKGIVMKEPRAGKERFYMLVDEMEGPEEEGDDDDHHDHQANDDHHDHHDHH